jgi:hypothetical protein
MEPRSLKQIEKLGTANRDKQFPVYVFAHDREIGSGAKRSEYWFDLDVSKFENSILFFDPDNGYETKTQHGVKWIRHYELRNILAQLPESSVALVYQHRPRRRWVDVFKDLSQRLAYAPVVVAAHESNLAFVAMATNATAGNKIAASIKEYAADSYPFVTFTPLLPYFKVAETQLAFRDEYVRNHS